jgi:hypothetical protein
MHTHPASHDLRHPFASLAGLAVLLGLAVSPAPALAATWHVDALAAPGGSGRTPSSAWRRFAEIDWRRIQPGDTLQVLGDACDPPFTETLTVGASGRAGAPLRILAVPRRDATGPVIDGEQRRDFGIVLRDRDHVVIRGFALRNHAEAGITVRGARDGVVVEANAIHSGDPGGGNARGIDARGNAGTAPLLIRGNRYTTPPATRAQTDGIWSSDNDGLVVDGNVIVIANGDMTGHSDGIQSFQDRRLVIRGNWIEQANAAPYHNHGIWLENTRDGGVIEVSGNVVLAPNLTGDAVVAHYMRAGWTGQGAALIRGNTILGGHRAIYLQDSPRSRVLGNVVAAAPGGHAAVILGAAPPPGAIDDNHLWSPLGTVAFMGGGNLPWSDWRARGYDARGLNADPGLDTSGRATIARVALSGGRGAQLARPADVPDPFACREGR